MPTKYSLCTFYGRYSPRPESTPRDEHGEALTNKQQLKLVQMWCEEKGLPDPNLTFYDREKSRDDMNRPGLWACVKATQGGIMLAYALDRVGDIIAIETVVRMLEKQKSILATVVEGFQENDVDSEFLRIIKGGFSRAQRRKMADDTRRHMRARMANGQCMTRHAPVGFKFEDWPESTALTRTGNKMRKMVPDIAEQNLIREIQQLHEELDVGPFALRTLLNKLGYKVRGGPIKLDWLKKALQFDFDHPTKLFTGAGGGRQP